MKRFCLFLLFFTAVSARGADLTLWYDQPAKTWMTEALPIGNGKLGGMIFGGVAQEHVQFNEDSLWTGHADPMAGSRPGGAQHIAEIQKLISQGQTDDATALIQRYLYGNTRGFGSYQPFGDLLIDEHSAADAARATDYRRELDLQAGVCRVHYTVDGVAYDRQFFCSYPDKVMVLHFACAKSGGLNLVLHGGQGQKWSVEKSKIVLQGTLADNGMGYQAVAVIRPEGANAESTLGADGISITNADTVNIYLAAATSYHGNDFAAANAAAINGVKYRSYDDVLAAHQKDYQALFNRVHLDLGDSPSATLPTDQRLVAYHKGTPDPGLEALLFQFTRYVMISSSRAGGLPANRQGLWNNDPRVQWGDDFPTMMNLEMIYLPVETANLPECAQPLFDMIDSLRKGGGRVAAKAEYGARGWIVNYSTNPWGYAAGGTGPYQYFPAGAAWLCQHLWEHYQFTQDKKFLAATAYPIMKEAAQFWVDHLITDSDGTLVSSPSESPEHGPFVAGAAMDQEIVWDLFSNCVAASQVLGIDDDFRATLQNDLKKLSGPKIGRLGQLQEWKADVDDPSDTHRHISHLFALFPGHQISALTTPDLAAAAKKSLEMRGDGGIGWALAWKIGYWARLLDGDHAHTILAALLTPTTATSPRSTAAGTYPNLFTARPPLQLDGSCAAAAGIVEMLLQSQNGEIDLLPALPKAWRSGSVKGLCARGGFVVDERWEDGALTQATIHSLAGGVCRVYSSVPVQAPADVDIRRPSDKVMEFDTQAGASYTLSTGR